jgi:hypothetical protein
MYIHLGQNVVVSEEDVIGIFDLDNTTGSYITRKFLSDAEKAGSVRNVSDELPRSFIVSGRNEKVTIYLSQLSPQTLQKRSVATQSTNK